MEENESIPASEHEPASTMTTTGRRPGHELADARERAGIERAAMADALRLPERQLAALESDDYSNLPPPAYVKGYLRSYARHVGLDGDDIVAAFDKAAAELHDPDLHPVTPQGPMAGNRGLTVGLLVIIVVVAAGLGGWWLQGRPPPPGQETASTAPSTSGAAGTESAAETEPTGDTAATGDEPSSAADTAATQASAQEVASSAEAGADAGSDSGTAGADGATSGTQVAEADSAGESQDAQAPESTSAAGDTAGAAAADGESEPGSGATTTAEDQQASADSGGTDTGVSSASADDTGSDSGAEHAGPTATASAEDAVAPAGAEGPDTLVLKFDGRSWVEVYDRHSDQKRELVYTLYRGSQPVTVHGWAPFDVFLGNSPAVEVTFNGQSVQKSAFTRSDNTAHFLVDSSGARRR